MAADDVFDEGTSIANSTTPRALHRQLASWAFLTGNHCVHIDSSRSDTMMLLVKQHEHLFLQPRSAVRPHLLRLLRSTEVSPAALPTSGLSVATTACCDELLERERQCVQHLCGAKRQREPCEPESNGRPQSPGPR